MLRQVTLRRQAEARLELATGNQPLDLLGDGGQRAVRSFVQRGGVLVAVGESLESFSGGDNPLLAVKREAALGREPSEAGGEKGELAEAVAITSDADAAQLGFELVAEPVVIHLRGMAVYSATKAFVTSFSEALHEELRKSPVHVSALCPGFVRTEFQEVAQTGAEIDSIPKFMWLNIANVVSEALAGAAKGKALIVPGAQYKSMLMWVRLVPRVVMRRISGKIVGI